MRAASIHIPCVSFLDVRSGPAPYELVQHNAGCTLVIDWHVLCSRLTRPHPQPHHPAPTPSPRSNYVCYLALVMSSFRLFYPHQAILTSILKWLHIIPSALGCRRCCRCRRCRCC